jgi:hypothetical protein
MARPGISDASAARKIGAGPAILLALAIPLWAEFRIPGNVGWNAFLAMILLGVAVFAFLAQQYFRAHAGEIGEARFDTMKGGDPNG